MIGSSRLKQTVSILVPCLIFCGFSMWPFSCSHSQKSEIVFTAVGPSFESADLIGIAFLPGQGGEAVVIEKNGTVSYLTKDFDRVSQTFAVDVSDQDGQGLLNVATDPDYASNHYIYLYHTLPSGSGNQIDRYTVKVDLSLQAFDLIDPEPIEEFPNGSGMAFGQDGDLFVGVVDGDVGRIQRIVPNRTPSQGGSLVSESYATGFKNPTTVTAAAVNGAPALFVGDASFQEIDLITDAGQSFGAKSLKIDKEAKSLATGAYETGDQYGDVLKDRLLYTDLAQGEVRGLKVNDKDEAEDDKFLGSQTGLTSMQQGPDGFLYTTALFGSDHLLRIDLAKK